MIFFQSKIESIKNLKKYSKTLFPYLGVFLAIILLGVLVFSTRLSLKSLSPKGFSFLTATVADSLSSNSLFAEPVKNFLRESPDMTFVQGNSLVGVSPPATVTSQVLGGVLGSGETLETRDSIIEYTVEPGDTLYSVSSKFDVSLSTILWTNDLSSKSVIKPGDKLLILPVSGTIHLVSKGDTLSVIAKTYKAEVKEIIYFNNLSSEGDIFIGDVLIVPGGEMPARLPTIAAIPLGESYFIFPAEGKITQGLHGPFANAVDIANKCGKIVVAAAGGTVQRAGSIIIGGNRVTILHPNGVVTYYGHLSAITVVPGQTVTAGQVIGYIGNTGYTLGATGCHVHFEVRGAKNFLGAYKVGGYLSWKK